MGGLIFNEKEKPRQVPIPSIPFVHHAIRYVLLKINVTTVISSQR